MDYTHALILSMVEGITEFLPVSSTGHLILASKLLKIEQTEFVKSFEIIIQLGAILAVVFLYWNKIWTSKNLWKPVIFAFIPTAIIGLSIYEVLKNSLLGNELVTVAALFIGGVLMILVELWFARHQKKVQVVSIENISAKNAVIIGLFQSLAIIPGVSRSASTIIGAMILKTDRKAAVEFSFLLAIPTIFAAVGLDLIRTKFNFLPYEWGLLGVGFAGSFFFALIAVRVFVKYIQNHTFISFGIYRVLLALSFFVLVMQ